MADDEKKNGEDSNNLESAGSSSSLETSADDNSLENSASSAGKIDDTPLAPAQQGSFAQRFVKKVNIYLLLFIFLLAVAGGIILVTYLNSKKQEKSRWGDG